MKKATVLILAVALITSLAIIGCGETTSTTTASSQAVTSETTPQSTTESSASTTTGEAKVLKIGLLEAETGWWAAALGTVTIQVCDAYVDWFNKKGGLTINGER